MSVYLLLSDVVEHMKYYDSRKIRNRLANNFIVVSCMRNILGMDDWLHTQKINRGLNV